LPELIVEFETIDSTNTEAHRRAASGERGPLWIRADRQEAGRGRSGRAWSSPAGNLSSTYLFMPESPRAVFHQLSFVAGVAAFDAVASYLEDQAPLQLKWPNDVLIGEAKIGGILVESSKYGEDTVVMIGIGINIAVTPPIAGRAVTRLDQHGMAPRPQDLLITLADRLRHWLAIWQDGRGFPEVREAWSRRAHAIGRRLTVNTNKQPLEGTFEGMAENGALRLKLSSGETVCVEHGDVSLANDKTAARERA